jgi:class 3 adenylate cyclase
MREAIKSLIYFILKRLDNRAEGTLLTDTNLPEKSSSMYRNCLFFILIFISIPQICEGQDTVLDSLKAELETAVEDTNKVHTLLAICQLEYRQTPLDAIHYGQKALALSEILDFHKGIALANKFIGMGYYFQGDYWETINHWQQSLSSFEAIDDKIGVSNILNNIGAVYYNEGDDTKALEFYLRSLQAAEETTDTLRIVTASLNVGTIYLKNSDTHNQAQEYYLAALPLIEKLGDYDAEGTATVNLGEIYYGKGSLDSTIYFDTALYYYERALDAFKLSSTGNVPFAMTCIGKVYMQREEYDKAIEIQKEAYEIAKTSEIKLEMTGSLLGLAETFVQKGDISSAISTYKSAELIAEEIGAKNELRNAYQGLAESYAKISDFNNAFRYQTLLTDIKDTLYIAANDRRIQTIQFNYELEKREGQIDLLTTDKMLQEAIIQKQKFVKNAFIVGFILILLVAFQTLRSYFRKVKTNKILDQQKVEIENLVLNILPAEVATELRTEGNATPRHYDSVSVLFTDFKGFTTIAGGLTPQQLVAELNEFFVAFDEITVRNNLEKIKTIGDAYMCAGGIPSKNDTHPFDTVKAGLEMQAFMERTNRIRESKGQQTWALRIGIHTGPLVAGVVGKKKFAYDIWGNAVNIASRMESSGEAGKVNISAATHALVCKQFNCEFRGKIYAKNVGDIEMYFVEPHSSQNIQTKNQKETAIP